MRNKYRLENHPKLKEKMIDVQKDIKNENANSAIQNILNCFDYIIEQYALEYGTREDDFGNKQTKERLSVLVAREQISSINEDFYDTVVFVKSIPDIPNVRSCYSKLLNLVDDFLDTFKYPTVKEFWVGLTPYEKGMQGHDEAKMKEAANNHPELLDLNDRFENHISIKDYKDAATNMRLILEYMVKQYSKEFAPDLYHEKIATQTEKLLERNIIDVSTKGDYDKLRKLGNAFGAHISEEKVDVDKVRECCYLISKIEADFFEVFYRPSDKEIPSKDNNNFINVEDIPVDHAYRNKSNKNNYSDDYFKRGDYVYRNGKTYRIFQGQEMELKEGITLLRSGQLSVKPTKHVLPQKEQEEIRKEREQKEQLEKRKHTTKIIKTIVFVIILLMILEHLRIPVIFVELAVIAYVIYRITKKKKDEKEGE